MSMIAAAFAAALASVAPVTPLFADDAPIAITIQGPLNEIARAAERSMAPHNGTLILTGTTESLPVRLSARGLTRRKAMTCSFPPLRVEFAPGPPPASLFAGQRRLKLVTHCQSSESFQQHVLLEYSAYRLFNLIDPASFRVRLATINYVEPDGRKPINRFGFFIEDLDHVARRNGYAEAIVGARINSVQLDVRQAARVAMFEYMISNVDWSMHAGPPGDRCCHNVRLLTAAPGRPPYIPLAYDFDYSGLVDAPYAVVPEGIRARDVRQRVYRGYCRINREALAVAAELRARRPEIEALYARLPAMSQRSRGKALAYLSSFFKDIETDESVRAKLFKTCVAG